MHTDPPHLNINVSHSLTTPYDGSSLSCLYSLRSCCVCVCVCTCVHVCVMFFHSSLNFLHPTVYMRSRFPFLCEFLHFSGFMYACLHVLSPCTCPFSCIYVWLQIAVCFDVYVCMSTNYEKYYFYLCWVAAVLSSLPFVYVYAFLSPLQVCRGSDRLFLEPFGFPNTGTCISLTSPRLNSCQHKMNLGTLPPLFKSTCTTAQCGMKHIHCFDSVVMAHYT